MGIRRIIRRGGAMLAAMATVAGVGFTAPPASALPPLPYSLSILGDASPLVQPRGVAVDTSGNVYIGDSTGRRLYKVTPGGVRTIIAGTGVAGSLIAGTATSSPIRNADGIAVDSAGNVYFADNGNSGVAKVTPGGVLSIVAGGGAIGSPSDVAVDSTGNLYIADYENCVIHKLPVAGALTVVAGTGTCGVPTPGVATSSMLNYPSGVAVDSAGNLYIADDYGHMVTKVTSGGVLSIFAGTGVEGFGTAGLATQSALSWPLGVAVDSAGNVYITTNGDGRVKKVDTAGYVSIIAGNGSYTTPVAGPALASPLNSVWGVDVDANGVVYVVDSFSDVVVKLALPSAPAAPTILSATAGIASASVAFTAGSDGGSAITKYQYKVGNGSWTDAAGTTSPITISGLTNYTSPDIRLRAVNAIGDGAASAGVKVWSRIAGPAITTATARSSSRISVAFAALTPGGGRTARHYWVFAYTKGTNSVVSSCRSSYFARTCVLSGLSAGMEYDVAVRGFFTVTGSPTVLPTFDGAKQTVRTRN